jgi:hypothetical protein
MLPNSEFICGYPGEWKAFTTRNSEFMKRFENIGAAINAAFTRIQPRSDMFEKAIYFLGSLVADEFVEVFLLCGNGYGIGAQKLVRGMYERAVTARYLFRNPAEAANFMAYEKIADHKMLVAVESSLSQVPFPPEYVERIKREYREVRPRFMITDCAECKTERLNHTWTKLDFVSMARMDKDLWPLIVPAYYIPTSESHSTMAAIFSRLDPAAFQRGDGLIIDPTAQRQRADQAITTAHIILLNILDLQRECFQLKELEPLMQVCFEDVKAIVAEHDLRPSTTGHSPS